MTVGDGDADASVGLPLVGILVGGQSRRMGGTPKGLLPAPDESTTIIERTIEVCRAVEPSVDVVLLGQHPAYAHLGLEQLADSPSDCGPIGGLGALTTRARPGRPAIVLACDMPFLTAELLQRLLTFEPRARAVAPRVGVHWLPTFARYEPNAALVAVQHELSRGHAAPRAVIDALGGVQLPLNAHERRQLRDWDSPADMVGD